MSQTAYSPKQIEDKWYSHWMEKDYFHSTPDEREAYSIVIPPPNVTGVLHMGHMLNNTIQDILIRKARLDGKNACWVPGTDHASIATEAKVVKMLREQGIKKSDLTREEFLDYAMEWKDKYGGIILDQLKKLGASCDWKRTAFTMDPERSKMVIQAFVDLYNRGKLYRGLRMVNWDPEAKTVLSNEEVIYQNEPSNLYKVKYQIEGTEEYITIATTRPETIMGDSAIAVHPDDDRYKHLEGKFAIVPLVNRRIPIIHDDYVEMEFGTGALKVTPAHDTNDYDIGKRHNLETIEILNDDGTLNERAEVCVGQDRFEARKNVKILLKESGNLVDIEQYTNNVGRSERTNAVIEPKLSLQWYVDMKSLAIPALEAVEKDEVEFFPKNQKNLYRHWMENIRDWCISRQLWWGHRIPVWYLGEDLYVATTPEEALQQAQEKTGDASLTIDDLKQDEDVLDTWFSSWLWPISVFNGWDNREELDYYYPTSVLVTGWDIIFLWVARMVMVGYEWEGKRPFKDVYFTGMVRDAQRRKMSKSLGNSPDALKLIEEYGADGVRFGMLSSSPAGGDLLFDVKLCEQGRNFSNKLWNARNLVDNWEVDASKSQSSTDLLAKKWLTQKMDKVLAEMDGNFKQYRLSEVLTTVYSFIWNDYCSWYLEIIKPPYGEGIAAETKEDAKKLFEKICIILHPYMPFITEEIWHQLYERAEGEDCIVSSYPIAGGFDADFVDTIEQAKDVISKVRDIRNKNGIKAKDPLKLYAIDSDNMQTLLAVDGVQDMISKIGHLSEIEITKDDKVMGLSFISRTEQFVVEVSGGMDVESEIADKEKELEYQQGLLKILDKKLSNERFVNNAPEQVVANERKKHADTSERIRIIEEDLSRLKGL